MEKTLMIILLVLCFAGQDCLQMPRMLSHVSLWHLLANVVCLLQWRRTLPFVPYWLIVLGSAFVGMWADSCAVGFSSAILAMAGALFAQYRVAWYAWLLVALTVAAGIVSPYVSLWAHLVPFAMSYLIVKVLLYAKRYQRYISGE